MVFVILSINAPIVVVQNNPFVLQNTQGIITKSLFLVITEEVILWISVHDNISKHLLHYNCCEIMCVQFVYNVQRSNCSKIF